MSNGHDFLPPEVNSMPRFCGIRTFMRLPYEPEVQKRDFVILGAPLILQPVTGLAQDLDPKQSEGFRACYAQPTFITRLDLQIS